MKKKLLTPLLSAVLLLISLESLASNGTIIGPTNTCCWIPVRYRMVFNAECTNPKVSNIGVYNSNTSSGTIVNKSFIERGTLSNGQIYEDYWITFGNNFNVFNPGNIDLTFDVTCESGGAAVSVTVLQIVLYPAPAVILSSDQPNNSFVFYTRYIGVYAGAMTVTATTGIPAYNVTYKWSVTGNSFSISGPDDQASVLVGSNTDGVANGTVTVEIRGLTNCDYVSNSHTVTAMFRSFPFSAADAKSSIIETPINVYPNPARNNLIVSLPVTATSNSKPVRLIRIYDMQMKLIKELRVNNGNTSTIDVSGLKNGAYFIRYSSDDKIAVKKFVVQK